MAIKRPKPEEIVVKLRQVEVLMGQGMPRIDAIRQISVTEQTYYRWKKKYGGMGTEQLKELKRLQKENERLRRAVSDLTLDKLILKGGRIGKLLSPSRRRACIDASEVPYLGIRFPQKLTPHNARLIVSNTCSDLSKAPCARPRELTGH